MSIAVMAAQSARPDAPGSGALAAAAGSKGKGSGDAMQDRPLRCQHGRRWSQSARARWRCISWRSGGRLAVPGPKSDRAGSRWRPHHTRKSRAARAMTPVLQDKHHHSTDLVVCSKLICFTHSVLFFSLHKGKRPRTCRIRLGGPEGARSFGLPNPSRCLISCQEDA